MLTWDNIEKVGGSKTNLEGDPDSLTYKIIDDKMHICAGDTKTDACQVSIQPFSIIQCLIQRREVNSIWTGVLQLNFSQKHTLLKNSHFF